MTKVRAISAPVIRLTRSAPWIFLSTSWALIPAATICGIGGNHTLFIRIAISVASAIAALFLTRTILKRDRSLIIPIGISLGCSISFALPATLPLYVAPSALFLAITLFQLLSLQRIFRLNIAVIAIALVCAAQYLLRIPFEKTGDPISGIIVSRNIPSIITFILHEGRSDYPALSAIVLLPALIIACATGILRIRDIISAAVGVAILVGTLHFSGHNDLFRMTWKSAVPPFLFVLIFFSADPLSTPRVYTGKVVALILFGIFFPLIFLITGNMLHASLSILLINLLTPLIDRCTSPRPFGSS